MRILFTASLCTVLLGAARVSIAQPQSEKESAIRGVVDGFAKSWNTPGMPGFADLFTQDADFVVISGRWFKGRDEIVNYHKELLGRFYKGSRLSPENVAVRFLSPGVAVAHVNWRSWYTDKDGKQQEQTALMTLTLTNSEGAWKIAAAHNTLTGGPRYSFHKPTAATN